MTLAAVAENIGSLQRGRKFRRLRWFARSLGLMCADASAFLVIYFIFRFGRKVPSLFFPALTVVRMPPIDLFLLLAVAFITVRALVGDYSSRLLFWDGARLTTKAIIVASSVDVLVLLIGYNFYSPGTVIASWLSLIIAVPVFRQLARFAMSKLGLWQIPSGLIADSGRAEDIRKTLSRSLSLGFEIRTVIGPPRRVASDSDAAQTHDPAAIVRDLSRMGCEQVIAVPEDLQSSEFSSVVEALLDGGFAVAIVPSLRRLPVAGLNANYFFGKDILLLHIRNNTRGVIRRSFKRLFDLLGAAGILVAGIPLFAFIAVLIKHEDGGPIFYRHKRIGRGGTPFNCLKFRTMSVDADRRLAQWKAERPDLYEQFQKNFKLQDDPRITRIGKWLRRTSLDELPQLVNVLRGDMSLVGPRPIVERELLEYYGRAAKLYCRVRPGITGLWQVSGRSDTSYEERVTYDEWYILNWTFWYDIVILIQTAWIVATGKGAV